MRHIIRAIDEDDWTTVEQGWKAPTMIMDDKSEEPKPKDSWSDADKAASKYNSKALTTIFSAVDLNKFKIIQGCESAKEAWDTLINHFEGNTSVRCNRIDHLASKFENLRMEEDETIGSFISKLSSIANEASVLGKKYNEKKLVKKLLRCLPPRFEAYKAVLKIVVNTDEMKFDQLDGILKVHDLERVDESTKDQKGVAFSAESKEADRVKKIEENMVLMAKNFNKMLKRVEKGHNRSTQRYQGRDRDRSSQSNKNDSSQGNRRKELQCHECEGFGHYRNKCPLTKRKELKCIECKGYGHTRSECPNNLKKDKSLICFSDTESDDDSESEELLLNFSAHVNTSDESHEPLIYDESHKSPSSSESDSETEADPEKEGTELKAEYQSLFDKFTELSLENLQLIKDRAMLKAQVNILELEQTENNSDSEKNITTGADKEDLNDLRKTISDQAYSLKILEGLGFQGKPSKLGDISEGITFVKSSDVTKSPEPEKNESVKQISQPLTQKLPTKRRNGCLFCCKPGHRVSNFLYPNFKNREPTKSREILESITSPSSLQRPGKEIVCNLEFARVCKFETDKDMLLSGSDESHTDELDEEDLFENDFTQILSNVAYTTSESSGQEETSWYFDSGCSRHMTGTADYLEKVQEITSGKVTFGDGGQGKISAIGNTERSDLPRLINVYLVDGLKANLISVSQLCDEGLRVIFDKRECQALDDKNNIILCGYRSANNCYMWKPSNQCMTAKGSQLELWHKKLGHMNTHGLSRLVRAEVIRGVPPLEDHTDSVCGACCQGKQVKVQHKQVSQTNSKGILELVHMDLMGPITPSSVAGKQYIFVLVDDFYRFTWVRFLKNKSDAIDSFRILALQLKQKKRGICQIRSDHGGEF
ncbi:uncharacterized protein LOC130503085 [Raphanus sativus]|uniref:Uncharacterized protein LOC130503085 n=1 Tax=Raphanus sativus TaxID=3726 RepID=A0A9W3CQB7_RAPSA|nr:uncharacterized protein LOC130503085 [Raphanus sativus]